MKVLCIKESHPSTELNTSENTIRPKVGYEYTVIEIIDGTIIYGCPAIYYVITELDQDSVYLSDLFVEIKSRTEEADEILKTINPEIHESNVC